MAKKFKTIDGFSNYPQKRRINNTRPSRSTAKKIEKINRNSGRLVKSEDINFESIPKKKKKLPKNYTEDFLAPVKTFGLEDDGAIDLDLDEETLMRDAKKATNNKKIKKKMSKKKKFIIAFLFLLLIGAAVFAWLWLNGFLSKITDGNANLFDFIVAKDVELKKDENGRTNILVFGTSGYDMSGAEGKGKHDGAQLTDSIMMVSFDQETKDLAMISVPRDLYVGKTCTATGKINEVYYCANQKGDDEEKGAKALQETMEKVTGLSSQYYVHLNWGALVQIVDALGGITVTLDENIKDNWTKTYISAGEPVTLNGEQALGLARARHGTTGGDFTRGASQQKILVALANKISEKDSLSVQEALGMMDALGDNLRMDFNADEIKTLVHLAPEVSLENMRQIPLTNVGDDKKNYVTTGEIGGISYVIPSAGKDNYTEIKKYIARMVSSDAATREEAKLSILNGSGASGLAAKQKEKLENAGFDVENIGDAPEGVYPDKYYIYDLTGGEKPGTKASLEKRYKVTAKPADELPEGIITTGYDFIIIIGNQDSSDGK